MGFTPYPNTNDQYENPSIVASNDGVNWVVPTGLVNPIGVQDPDLHLLDPGLHLADTELVYNKATNKLRCYWVQSGERKLIFRES